MIKLSCAAAVAVALVVAPVTAGRREAACFKKTASGTAGSIDGAKFQVKEAILQSFDWGVWAAFMATGSTPGYRVTSNGLQMHRRVASATTAVAPRRSARRAEAGKIGCERWRWARLGQIVFNR